MSNPSLGTIACPTCNEPGADVRQTKRRGAHLYWQCAGCGVMQPTGKGIQTRLWRETEWKAGAEPKRPGNVAAEVATTEPAAEFDPSEAETATDETTDSEPASDRPRPIRGAGVLLLGALGLGAFLANR